jgi:SAM-dependent methyltransferase
VAALLCSQKTLMTRTASAIAMRPAGGCPICGSTAFEPGPKGRLSPSGVLPRCAKCRSLERHRIFRLMFERLGLELLEGWSAIQFSPDPTIDPKWFARYELSIFGEPGGEDIQRIGRPNAAFDLVGCSHVLEHVADDRAALNELLRIAAPDGLLFLVVPDPFREEKTRDWGFPKPEKHGHYRVYGADIVERFRAYIPTQPVLAYRGEDPVTGEREGCFLLPKSASMRRRIEERLGASVQLFNGPSARLGGVSRAEPSSY